MKMIKQCPLFLLIISTGLFLTLAAAGGRNNIYKNQEYHPLEEPMLALVLDGLNENVYPWQLFTEGKAYEEAMAENPGPEENGEAGAAGTAKPSETPAQASAEQQAAASPEEALEEDEEQVIAAKPTLAPEPTPAPYGEGRPEPLRASTQEEYLKHISADIYGDAGTLKAASYDFIQVEESYFDDALFIGDSRTVGLRDYTDLSEHADFCCETSLTIYKVLEEEFQGPGTVEEALKAKDYGKIYIMVGINELGRGTTEDFMSEYTKVVDTLHEWEPEAKIIIQGIMRVTKKKSESDAVFNNDNINARNNAIATLADNEHIFYIDVNEAVCDEEGNLNSDYTFDQIHLLGVYDELWKQFLMSHGVG